MKYIDCPRADKEKGDKIFRSACKNCTPEKWGCKIKKGGEALK